MIALTADDVADLRRWVISAAVIVLAHGAIAGGMLTWREAAEPADPGAAIVIDFAPVPVGPPLPQNDFAPGPDQMISEATPDQIAVQKPLDEPPPEIKPAANPELSVPPEEVKQEIAEMPRPAVPVTTAPQSLALEAAPIAAAPIIAPRVPDNPAAILAWRTQISTLLERNKRYPESAASRREHGVAQVFFSLDQQGHVLDSRILRSAGAPALDAEALALISRAQPFPPPPPEAYTNGRINLTVPIRFNLK
jgi:periplasmic protein TonB